MPWIASFFAVLATLCWYLSAPQQRLCTPPLGRGWGYAGWLLAIVAFALWMASLDTMSGFISAMTAAMFGAVAMPYLVWLFRPAVARGLR